MRHRLGLKSAYTNLFLVTLYKCKKSGSELNWMNILKLSLLNSMIDEGSVNSSAAWLVWVFGFGGVGLILA